MAKYENKIKKAMEELGTYKAEFRPTIGILAEMLNNYDEIVAEFEPGIGKYIIYENGKMGKNPIYTTVEKLRADILVYMRELGLTPAGLKKMQVEIVEGKKSRLAEALGAISEGVQAESVE